MTKYWTCGGILSSHAPLAMKDCTGIAAFAISASTTRRVAAHQQDHGKNQTAVVAAVGTRQIRVSVLGVQHIHSQTLLMQQNANLVQ